MIDGAGGYDVIAGTGTNDRIDLRGVAVRGIDRIDAGSGNDIVVGTPDADVIIGGAGRDLLVGGGGDDQYGFNRGDGRDRIRDLDTSPNSDKIAMGTGIRHDQLWFSRARDDLSIAVIGTRDRIVINNWYRGENNQVEMLQAGDGLILMNTEVDQLVQAMASFSPPASGELDLSPELQSQLEPVLAATWE